MQKKVFIQRVNTSPIRLRGVGVSQSVAANVGPVKKKNLNQNLLVNASKVKPTKRLDSPPAAGIRAGLAKGRVSALREKERLRLLTQFKKPKVSAPPRE